MTGSDQTIECPLTGLSTEATVIWLDPSGNVISNSINYQVNQGNFASEDQTSTLTIKKPILDTITTDTTFQCKSRSGRYPVDSPDVLKSIVVTPLNFGKHSIF